MRVSFITIQIDFRDFDLIVPKSLLPEGLKPGDIVYITKAVPCRT